MNRRIILGLAAAATVVAVGGVVNAASAAPARPSPTAPPVSAADDGRVDDTSAVMVDKAVDPATGRVLSTTTVKVYPKDASGHQRVERTVVPGPGK